MGKESSHPRSHASGKADVMGSPLVCWLIEPKRPSTVIKFSGTLKHPASREDMLGLTIYAFAHFVYLTSKGSRVIADIQGICDLVRITLLRTNLIMLRYYKPHQWKGHNGSV